VKIGSSAGTSEQSRPGVFVWAGMTKPTIRTPEKEAEVLREIRKSGNATTACIKAKVGRHTWYDWLETDPELRAAHKAAMDAGRENKADVAEDALMTRINKGDTTAIIFALKTLRRPIYGDRSLHEVTGADGAPLMVMLNMRPDGPD
jgi:hypothetical protein